MNKIKTLLLEQRAEHSEGHRLTEASVPEPIFSVSPYDWVIMERFQGTRVRATYSDRLDIQHWYLSKSAHPAILHDNQVGSGGCYPSLPLSPATLPIHRDPSPFCQAEGHACHTAFPKHCSERKRNNLRYRGRETGGYL